ncbi:MAG: peptidylprolyl isomerase [Planctomycetales bacterium]|nr:peptidylprolyl isomerase [Planctomycetales bacterium]
MLRPILPAVIALLVLGASLTEAQTVRFLTSVGAFDMRLNPTDNPNLQSHIDNLVAYVGSGRYHAGVVNRAPDGFVLQLGGFMGEGVSIDTLPLGGFDATDAFNNVTVDANNDGQVDFSTNGLTNTRGTVSLALAAGDANSGTSSFFVNIGDNSFLDSQNFVPFAVIDNMATIDRIMALEKVDLSSQVGQPGSLAYTDVPVTADGELVVLESIMVISESSFSFEGPIRSAAGLPEKGSPASLNISDMGLAATSGSAPSSSASALSASTASAPEPAALVLLSLSGLLAARRRR